MLDNKKEQTTNISQSMGQINIEICCCSVAQSCWTLCDPMGCSTPQCCMSLTISPSLLKLISIELVMRSNHLVLCCPLFLLPSVFPSIRLFSNESVLRIRWLKQWSFTLSISPSNEYSGLISLRIDWFDLLAVQGTQESSPTPQFKSINSSVLSLLCGPALTFIHDYWTNHCFDQMDLCWQVMFLFFNMPSRLVKAFLPKSKHLLISWLQSPSGVVLEPKKMKSVAVFTFLLSICHEVMGPDAMVLVF